MNNMDNIVFYSRRNRVWLEDGYIYKLILPGTDRPDTAQAAQAEADMLKHLLSGGVSVPRLFSINGDLLTMEYIKGITLVDAIERAEKIADCLSAELLGELISRWFAEFYATLPEGTIRGDVNCRNFILTPENRLFGVDFENLPHGQRETDLGRMTAYILTYSPPYTPYKRCLTQALTDCFASHFKINYELVFQNQANEIQDMNRRRN